MGINVTDTSGANQNDVIQRHGETREIQGIEIAPISTKVEEATRRIQNGQGSTADVRIVNQAAQNTQAVNNNLRRRGL